MLWVQMKNSARVSTLPRHAVCKQHICEDVFDSFLFLYVDVSCSFEREIIPVLACSFCDKTNFNFG